MREDEDMACVGGGVVSVRGGDRRAVECGRVGVSWRGGGGTIKLV